MDGPSSSEETSMSPNIKGRGTAENPGNRFETKHFERDPDTIDPDDPDPSPATVFIPDRSRTIIATNDSPDVGFEASINPYRGCEHGCAYCYARPTHEYLGFSAGLDFETKILVKHDAPALLRRELMKPGWVPKPIAISGVTDAYQPAERKFRLTRGCLEVLAEFRNPVGIVTKNRLVARDADVLADLARHKASVVYISITTLDQSLGRSLEPRASAPSARLEAIRDLTAAGVPVGVLVAPIIPGLNDHEIPSILAAAAEAGARFAGYIILRLPLGVADLFTAWLDRHVPLSKDKVLSRLRSMRDGKLNLTEFGRRMSGEGPHADLIRNLFRVGSQRAGISAGSPGLTTEHFRRPGEVQLRLFE
jgi:DNA repair photolyase